MSGKKIINAEAITQMGTASNAAFQRGLTKGADPVHLRIATRVGSTTGKEEYSWLGKWPRIREWVGERLLQQLKAHSYTIRNKSFESTVVIDRDDVEDDNVGLYAPMFEEMGQEVFDFPSELVFGLLKTGDVALCYDGQPYFSAAHPVVLADGSASLVSNWQGGAGEMWILAATKRALKPVIFQERRPFGTVSLDNADDTNVFMRKEYIYGTDGRMNVGFGFWQFAVASKQPLTAANYALAYAALEQMIGDGGRPLGLKPDLLLTTPANRSPGQQIVNTMLGAGGASNEWYQTADHVVTAWLK